MSAAATLRPGGKRLAWLLAALAIAFILVVTDKPPATDVVAPAVRPAGADVPVPTRATPGAVAPMAAPAPAVGAAPAPVVVPSPGAPPPTVAAAGDTAMIAALRPRTATAAAANAFPSQDWTPPPPKPSAAALALAAKPVMPAFPYKVLGKQRIDNRWEVFLDVQGRTVVAREGERVDAVFTIERIAPPTMTIQAAAFEERQSVAIGEGER